MIDTQAMRSCILQLAFSGKLTHFHENDDSIDDFLKRIDSSKIIKQKDNAPYEIPNYWAWVKLGDLYTINPKVNADDETLAAFVPMERISAGFDRTFSYEEQKWGMAAKNHTKFSDGDVAFAKITPCFENRKSFIASHLPNGIGGGTTELIILRQKEIVPEYTYYTIIDERFIRAGTSTYKGMVGQQRVKLDVLKNYLVPVPPYQEQKRVVKKIQEAFSYIEAIETLQKQFKNNLSVLKNKMIDAAIRGKLTEQLPEDGTAEELYQQIQQEKKKLEQEGKIKESKKAIPSVMEEEEPFIAPQGWKWGRLIDIFNFIDYRGATPTKIKTGIPFITAKNVRQGFIDYSIEEFISEEDYHNRQSRGISHKGDILFTTEAPMGYAAIADLDTYSAGQRLITLQQYGRTNVLDNKYYMYYISTNYFQRQLLEKSSGTTVKGIKADRLKQLVVPIPPLAEQERIVECLVQLMKILK